MKHVNESIIAKKYATAFLNLHDDFLQEEHIRQLKAIEQFLKKNKNFYISLGIPTISRETKKIALQRVIGEFHLGRLTLQLMLTLLDHGRIEILDRVLYFIDIGYRRRKNIESYTIISSHALNESQKKDIEQFITTYSSATIRCKFVVDSSLIVGIRIESNTFLWERSMRRKLRRMSQSILRKG